MEKSIENLKYNKKKDEELDDLSKNFNDYFKEISFLISKAEECQSIIDEYDNLSNPDFYKKIKALGIGSDLTELDIINIIGLYYGREYEGIEKIQTNMSWPVIEEYGHGKDLERRREFRTMDLEVIYGNCNLSNRYRYSKEEIDKLVNYQKIIILRNKIDWDNSCGDTNRYPEYPTVFGKENQIEDSKGKYYRMMLKYLKTKITKEKLIELQKKLVSIIKKEKNIMDSINKRFNNDSFQKKLSKFENK